MSFKNRSKKEPAGYWNIKYFAHDTPIKRYLQDGGGYTEAGAIAKGEKKLLDNTVEWAVFYLRAQINHYHHHKAAGGIKSRLNAEQYRLCLDAPPLYSLWIVPTEEARYQGKTAERVNGVLEEDIELYMDKQVKKIEVYLAGQKVATRQKGGYV